MRVPYRLDAVNPAAPFPPAEHALSVPDGLLAVGGDLSAVRLLNAYRHGIFPWYSPGEPILWWAPDPRAVLFPERFHAARSLRKRLRLGAYRASYDGAFAAVAAACAAPRARQTGTWITPEMHSAYVALHHAGHAHSIEIWNGDALAGGLYGVALGRVFFGESMFSRVTDGSKLALAHLVGWLQSWGYALIDCQMPSAHLERMGAELIPRRVFSELLHELVAQMPGPGAWASQSDMDTRE